MLNLIYSVSVGYDGGIIGVNNDLYVKLKQDMEYFKTITSSKINNKTNSIIMGYNTWLSIGKKPLENRINIVISTNHYDELSEQTHCLVFKTIDDCVNYLKSNDIGIAFVIGGSTLLNDIYKNYFHLVNTIYLTSIKCEQLTHDEKISYKKNNITTLNYKQWIALWEKAKNKCIPRKFAFKYPLPTFKHNKRDLKNLLNN